MAIKRSIRFDSAYDSETYEWLEAACGDPTCEFCKDRPPTMTPRLEQQEAEMQESCAHPYLAIYEGRAPIADDGETIELIGSPPAGFLDLVRKPLDYELPDAVTASKSRIIEDAMSAKDRLSAIEAPGQRVINAIKRWLGDKAMPYPLFQVTPYYEDRHPFRLFVWKLGDVFFTLLDQLVTICSFTYLESDFSSWYILYSGVSEWACPEEEL